MGDSRRFEGLGRSSAVSVSLTAAKGDTVHVGRAVAATLLVVGISGCSTTETKGTSETSVAAPTTSPTGDGSPPTMPDDATLAELVTWSADEARTFWESQGASPQFTVEEASGRYLTCGSDGFPLVGAIYCEHVIKWLARNLNRNFSEYGRLSITFEIAQEVGSAVQDSEGALRGNPRREEGTDCFAGAFLAYLGMNEEQTVSAVHLTRIVKDVDRIDAAQRGFESKTPLATCLAYR